MFTKGNHCCNCYSWKDFKTRERDATPCLCKCSNNLCLLCIWEEPTIFADFTKLFKEISQLFCRYADIAEVVTGFWKVEWNAPLSLAQCFMRGEKFRKNFRLFLQLLQKKVCTQSVWLNGFEIELLHRTQSKTKHTKNIENRRQSLPLSFHIYRTKGFDVCCLFVKLIICFIVIASKLFVRCFNFISSYYKLQFWNMCESK